MSVSTPVIQFGLSLCLFSWSWRCFLKNLNLNLKHSLLIAVPYTQHRGSGRAHTLFAHHSHISHSHSHTSLAYQPIANIHLTHSRTTHTFTYTLLIYSYITQASPTHHSHTQTPLIRSNIQSCIFNSHSPIHPCIHMCTHSCGLNYSSTSPTTIASSSTTTVIHP